MEGEINDEEGSIKCEMNDEDVLKGLQPHPNLKMLGIGGFKGTSFPSWTLRMAVYFERNWEGLNNLMDIRLQWCEFEEIPTLGHLPRLKSLKLRGLRNVKCICSSFYGIERCSSTTGICRETINVFPALEKLTLRDMPDLKEWAEVDIPSAGETHEARGVKAFPCLTDLSIMRCKQLANICGVKLTSLTKLRLFELEELVCLPDEIFLNNPNLLVLCIECCPKLRELPDGLLTLTSLRELQIIDCNNLKSIPYFRIRSLQTLSISDLDCELQHLFGLENLLLCGLGTEELPEWIGNLSSIQSLSISKCKQLRSLPSVEAVRRLTNLKRLKIIDCPLLKERCNPQQSDDSEWPKTSHIPEIYVDWDRALANM